jgi:cytoskeleton protein RodZ
MSDFGTQLKQARENRGISLRQIATSTKISVVALEALERGDFSRLPGGIFSRAFVRSYAIEVGLDPDEVVAQFLVELGAAVPAEDDTPRPDVTDDDRAFLERQRKAGMALRIGLAVLALLIVVSVVAWQMSRAGDPPQTPQTESAPPPAPTPAAPAAPVAQTPAVPQNAGGLRIELIANDSCWVQVRTDGVTRPARVMARGERETFDAKNEMVVSLGSAGAITWTINGRAAKPLGRIGEVKSITVSLATAPSFLQEPDGRPTPTASATARP